MDHVRTLGPKPSTAGESFVTLHAAALVVEAVKPGNPGNAVSIVCPRRPHPRTSSRTKRAGDVALCSHSLSISALSKASTFQRMHWFTGLRPSLVDARYYLSSSVASTHQTGPRNYRDGPLLSAQRDGCACAHVSRRRGGHPYSPRWCVGASRECGRTLRSVRNAY